MRRGMCFASCGCLAVCLLVDYFAYQAQYAPDNVSHDYLAWLR